MDIENILETLQFTIPSLVTGFVAYYFFNQHIKKEKSTSKLAILIEKKKIALPIKLQAYERLLLFCQRVNPLKLLLRIKPIGDKTEDYLQLLISNIDQELEHNAVQQIYVSTAAWNTIVTTKIAIINTLKATAIDAENATDFREKVFVVYSEKLPPTNTAISFIKTEVKKLL